MNRLDFFLVRLVVDLNIRSIGRTNEGANLYFSVGNLRTGQHRTAVRVNRPADRTRLIVRTGLIGRIVDDEIRSLPI